MFKRLMLIVCAVILLLGLTLTYSAPLFYKKSKTVETYIGDSSSLTQIENLTFFEFLLTKGVKGESVCVEKEGFNLNNLLKEFKAKLVFTESIEQGTSYYAYSPKIPYEKKINGQSFPFQKETFPQNFPFEKSVGYTNY